MALPYQIENFFYQQETIYQLFYDIGLTTGKYTNATTPLYTTLKEYAGYITVPSPPYTTSDTVPVLHKDYFTSEYYNKHSTCVI